MAQQFSTADVRERERFDYWCEAVSESYVKLGCESARRGRFEGAIVLSGSADMRFSQVSGSAQRVRRRQVDIARCDEESFLLSLQLRGRCQVQQAGRIAELEPGDMALYSSTERYQLSLDEGFAQRVVQLPKQTLLARLPQAEASTAVSLPAAHPLAALLQQNILGAVEVLDSQPAPVQRHVQDALVDLMAAGFSALSGQRAELSRPEQHLLMRARAVIRARLDEQSLSREAIAAELGVSCRRLAEVFTLSGDTVCAYLRRQRLESVACALRNPQFARHTISELALRWGFGSLAHFSHRFRRQFGCSPRDYRRQHAAPPSPRRALD